MRGHEGFERHAMLENPGDRRIGSEIEPVSLGVDNLRYERNVGKTGCVAVAELASPRILRKQLFERLKACSNPVVVPAGNRGLVMAERMGNVAQHPQIIDRMDVAGDNLGERADPSAVSRVLGQQRWFWISLVEILDDRQGLDQCSVAIYQRRHQSLRVDGEIIGLALVIAPQMDRGGFVLEFFQIEGDPDAECGGGSEITVELHAHFTTPSLGYEARYSAKYSSAVIGRLTMPSSYA